MFLIFTRKPGAIYKFRNYIYFINNYVSPLLLEQKLVLGVFVTWVDEIANNKKKIIYFNKFITYLGRNTAFSWVNENHLYGRKNNQKCLWPSSEMSQMNKPVPENILVERH